jgi:hypothetical protein
MGTSKMDFGNWKVLVGRKDVALEFNIKTFEVCT